MRKISVPVYKSDDEGYLTKKGVLSISGFSCHNTVCESGLRGENFSINNFDKRFVYIRPDILHIDENNRKVMLIEVKALSESVARNIELYQDLYEYLRACSWNCNLYYLLSHGHEEQQDWPLMAKYDSNIIIWEDLFMVMAQTPIANLIGDCLNEYCDPPANHE